MLLKKKFLSRLYSGYGLDIVKKFQINFDLKHKFFYKEILKFEI